MRGNPCGNLSGVSYMHEVPEISVSAVKELVRDAGDDRDDAICDVLIVNN